MNAAETQQTKKGVVKSESHLVVSNSSRPHGPQPSKAPLMVGFSKQEHWSGYHSFLQRIFPTQGWNLGLLHWLKNRYQTILQSEMDLENIRTIREKFPFWPKMEKQGLHLSPFPSTPRGNSFQTLILTEKGERGAFHDCSSLLSEKEPSGARRCHD